MIKHLTKDELSLMIQKEPSNLLASRFLHYEKCKYCRHLYNEQKSINGLLTNLQPKKAPEIIIRSVVRITGKISDNVPKNKTDWLFLFALITLFIIGAWFLFSSALDGGIEQYLPQLFSDTERTFKTPEFINSFQESIKGINYSDSLLKINAHLLYMLFGFLSFLLYIYLDKKYGHGFSSKSTLP